MSIFVRTPASQQDWPEISKLFEKQWNYPHNFAAIYGKHAAIRKPDLYYETCDHS